MRKRHAWWVALTRSLGRPHLRRVLGAYLGFVVCEHAHWIAILVWSYDLGGVRGAGAMALVRGARDVAGVTSGRASRQGSAYSRAHHRLPGPGRVVPRGRGRDHARGARRGGGRTVGADGGRGDTDAAGAPRDAARGLRDDGRPDGQQCGVRNRRSRSHPDRAAGLRRPDRRCRSGRVGCCSLVRSRRSGPR